MFSPKTNFAGVLLALLSVLIWSGNFIVAKGVVKQIPPVSLAFYRWLLATLVIFPFAFRSLKKDWPVIIRSLPYLLGVSLTGISLFNTFVYIGAHYTTAINLSLISTTSSPVFAVILAAIFLKEKTGALKIAGLILCIAGVLFLLSKGNWHNLMLLQFSAGDAWVLMSGFSFAIYTNLVRKRPAGISTFSFLSITFTLGLLLLIPFYLWENFHAAPVAWNSNLLWAILFLGLGASVISFLSWNMAVGKLGAGRTALFGNLIPVLTSIEAAIILGEKFTNIHVVSMILVFAGIVLANWKNR
jgi:drug/metabolite transporter (DMT)-like permease